MDLIILGVIVAGIAIVALTLLSALFLRRVVPTNEVHIVQTRKLTVPYGKDMGSNSYYDWPAWIPWIGLTTIRLPVSIFDLSFNNYEAYDKERVPFVVDITAFFRVLDAAQAAQRISSFEELREQLTAVVKGAVRTVLANEEIDVIMLERSRFGEAFTNEIQNQLKSWGVESVKNIELMDIRDSSGSEVIQNIMAKRTSAIERDSRIEVANNGRAAEISEIAAQRDVDVQKQEALQQVGQRTAETEKAVGIAKEQSRQEVLLQERETTQRKMAVQQVEEVRTAEIEREVRIVKAEEQKQTSVIEAEGEQQQTVIIAEGKLEAKKREATGILVEGQAHAEAEKAMQLAPVEAQIVLAKEIGENQGYQAYLLGTDQIAANKAIGIEQAQALQTAGIKVIVSAGSPTEGIHNISELFSAKGGQAVASMLEGLQQTETGTKVVDRATN